MRKNKNRMVRLRDVMGAPVSQTESMEIPVYLGIDDEGNRIIADLAAFPGLLMGGATGSGKSECIHSIITSLVTRFSPERLQMLIIEPKGVEAFQQRKFPHLLHPTLFDCRESINALEWLVAEMEKRHQMLTATGSDNFRHYFPYIAVIIDEFSDLVLCGQDGEEPLVRLAANGAEFGIHAVIATSKTHPNIITDRIRRVFKARIAFQVYDKACSRLLIDRPGAENLTEAGDMIFRAPDSMRLQRIQGCLVGEKEGKAAFEACRKKYGKPGFDKELKKYVKLQRGYGAA
ncbi:MAG: FtsK/SpoIIIE domain-containing protein [Planctomycetota bacterium]|jgi:S-DNA-T family DNA segregation ATPase FtsK/SpoIIIE